MAVSTNNVLQLTAPPTVMSGLPDVDRRLLDVGKVIIEGFASLLNGTKCYLQERNCVTASLVTCVMDVRRIKSPSKSSPLKYIVSATGIGDVFTGLISRRMVTFLHYAIMKRIICNLCPESQELQMKVKAYEEEFGVFTQKRVLENAMFYNEKVGTDSEDMVELLIKPDNNWNEFTTFVNVLNLEEAVAHAFQCNTFILHLESIEPHCMQLCYKIPISILNIVFPLTTEEWVSLTCHGIMELRCLDFHYTTHKRGKATPFKEIVVNISRMCNKLSQQMKMWCHSIRQT